MLMHGVPSASATFDIESNAVPTVPVDNKYTRDATCKGAEISAHFAYTEVNQKVTQVQQHAQ